MTNPNDILDQMLKEKKPNDLPPGVTEVPEEKPKRTIVLNLDEKDRKAEMALLVKLEEITSAGGRRAFCEEIGCPWEEYLRLKRKWRIPLERYRKEKSYENNSENRSRR